MKMKSPLGFHDQILLMISKLIKTLHLKTLIFSISFNLFKQSFTVFDFSELNFNVSIFNSLFGCKLDNLQSVAIKMFKCKLCDKVFSRKFNLKRHSETSHQFRCDVCNDVSYDARKKLLDHKKTLHPKKCDHCDKSFTKLAFLKYHLKTCKMLHKKLKKQKSDKKTLIQILCDVCGESYSESYKKNHLKSLKHIDASLKALDGVNSQCFIYETCFDNKLIIYQIKNTSSEEFEISALNFLKNTKHCLIQILKNELEIKQSVKFRLGITGVFINNSLLEKEINIDDNRKQFFNDFQLLLHSDDIEKVIDEACSNVSFFYFIYNTFET